MTLLQLIVTTRQTTRMAWMAAMIGGAVLGVRLCPPPHNRTAVCS